MLNFILLRVMKRILNITENNDGTYSLSNLTVEQMQALQSALIHNYGALLDLKERKQREGLDLNAVAAFYLAFAEEASIQLRDDLGL